MVTTLVINEPETIYEVNNFVSCFDCGKKLVITEELKQNESFDVFFNPKKWNTEMLDSEDNFWFSEMNSKYSQRIFNNLEDARLFFETITGEFERGIVEDNDNEEIRVTYMIYFKNYFCNDCHDICGGCGDHGRYYEFTDNENWCNECFNDNYFYCGNCNEIDNAGDGTWVEFRDEYWCESCTHNLYYCSHCQTWEQEPCDLNYESDDVERWNRQDYEGIYSYNFKPDRPNFFLGSADSDNQKLTFGFELEVESEGARFSDGLKIIRESLGDFVYMKGDGSLNCGYEIVTYPFSFNYYQEAIDFGFLKQLQELGYRSWTPETCGFHIHIARAGFESAGHIWKFANLILQNPRAWQKLAGRSGSRWASYSETDNPVMKVLKCESEPMRYVAVNMTNPDTIEVRIFRGSLNETRIRSAIESIYCAMEYTRNLSVHDINQGGLKFESFVNWFFSFSTGLDFFSFKKLLEKYELINSDSVARVQIPTNVGIDLVPSSPESVGN